MCVRTFLKEYDSYWKHGSAREDTSRFAAPVLAVGGWHDGYRDAALRMCRGSVPGCRAVVGPWSHEWPDAAVPGPNVSCVTRQQRPSLAQPR